VSSSTCTRVLDPLCGSCGAIVLVQKFGGGWTSPSKSSRVRSVRLVPQEEQAILQITRELISRLEVHDLSPEIVIAGGGRNLDPQIYKDKVILPFSLHNRLTPDEWRPLIASRLIFHRNFNKKKKLVAYSGQLFPYLTIVPFVAASSILGIIPRDPTVNSVTFFVWLFAMFLVAKLVYAPFYRRLQQTADKQTLELYLNPTLEDVLRKIEMMNPQGSKANKTIQKRIRSFREST
jgi:hypothetical protein